jgi:adenylate cyclase, class 2
MSKKNEHEIEVKFLIKDLEAFEQRLKSHGAKIAAPRVHEVNLRFDTPENELSEAGRVLRLRRDSKFRLTYKDPARPQQDVSVRREIEFEVNDFDTAREFLEALGYEVRMMYEKYRATYEIAEAGKEDEGLLVTLDNMPFGDFVEIEGPDALTIQYLAEELGLDWEKRGLASYLVLFSRICSARNYQFQSLSFSEFEGLDFSPMDIGMEYADQKA